VSDANDKIVIFYPEIVAFGGEERNILAISRFLHEKGFRHSVVCYYDKIGLPSYADWPVEVQELQPRRNPLLKAWAMARFLKARANSASRKPLLIGLQSAYHVPIFFRGDYFLRISDMPSLLSKAGLPSNALARLVAMLRARAVHLLTRRGFRGATCVIAMTTGLAEEMRELYGVNAVVMHIGGKKTRQQWKYRRFDPGNTLHLLSISRIEASKRIDWMLRVLHELEKSEKPLSTLADWRLHIVGVGSKTEEWKRMAIDFGLAERVKFHGFVTDGQMENLYAQAHIFVMPARQGFGIPAVEALDRKIPVVVHRESGVSEILEDTPWAELFDGGPEKLAAAVERMLSRVLANELADIPLPPVPTEDQWAEDVCRLGGWIA
jgi:glycosyltransferase involved in cell wall biosynthesis